MVVSWLLWFCCGLLLYVYVLYPVLVSVWSRRAGRPVLRSRIARRVTIVVTAFNEERCIAAKLDNLAALNYPADSIDVLVVSDGSSDRTEEIASAYPGASVQVLRIDGRKGKTACQNAAAIAASGEILVFTDATTRLHPDALWALVENFEDPTVGCVGGRLEYVTDIDNITGCANETYWSYEMRLRAGESLLGSLIGVSGCLYAVRKQAYRAIDPELISDFVIAMRMQEQGLRTVLAAQAVCFEKTLSTGASELSMRVRVAVRSLNALVRERQFLNPFKFGRFAWQLWSHKVLRYASPLIWLVALTTNALLADQPAYLALLCGQNLLIVAGVAGFLLQETGRDLGFLGRPYYLLLTNAASFIATLRYLRGERMVTWTPIRQPDHP